MTALPATSIPPAEAAPPAPRRSSVLLGTNVTFSGALTMAVILLVGVAALNSEANLLFLLFGISVGVVLFNVAAPMWMIRSVDVERVVPNAVVAGRPFKLVYIVRNRRRWGAAWSLVIHEGGNPEVRSSLPYGFIPVLPARGEQRIELTAVLPCRGRASLKAVRVMSRFPFGLFSAVVDTDSPADIIIYPAVGRFRRDPWKDRRYSGSATRNELHDGQDEFFGLREYREGDNPRLVHWRRSARTGELVVREMLPVRPTQLIVLLDPWPEDAAETPRPARRKPTEEPDADVERLLSAAATAICEGIERGHRVGIICRAAVPLVIPPAAGRPQRQRLLHELALITPGCRETLDQLIPQIRSSWHARCLVCTTRPNATHGSVIRFLAGRAEAVMLVSPAMEGFDNLFDMSREAVLDRRAR